MLSRPETADVELAEAPKRVRRRIGSFDLHQSPRAFWPGEASSIETLQLSRLPCWEHLSPKAYRARIVDLVAQVEEEARLVREAEGLQVVGRLTILRQDPHWGPERERRSLLPLFHTAGKEALLRLREAYSAFLATYREASARLREGYLDVAFPEGCFPPGLPFVPAARAGPVSS